MNLIRYANWIKNGWMIKQEIQNNINQISNDLEKVAHIPKSEKKN